MTPPAARTALRALDPARIDLDPTQPRRQIDQPALDELTASVREQGVRVPIAVAPTDDGRYRLIYGERRLRAALSAGLPSIPCLILAAPDGTEALDLQIVENMCRAELRPLDLAQALWRRILAAQIAALEAEQGDDGGATARLLADAPTPAGQIAALEGRLCALAGVTSVAGYFGGGRVRAPRTAILARYGMADWSAARLKKLFQTLDVAPAVQDMLAGADVSARALRDLAKRDPAAQADLVHRARDAASRDDGDIGGALRDAMARADAGQADEDGDAFADELAAPDNAPGANTFTPDPSLALLTSTGGSAPKLVTDRPTPARGSAPPVRKAGEWPDDDALQLEGALEAALHLFDAVGVLHFSPAHRQQLEPLWVELCELMQHALDAEAA